jgi:DNA modification methylase
MTQITIGNATLYHGDCREILPTLGRVDAVLADPPYGIKVDREMASKSGTRYGKAMAAKSHYEASGWDDVAMSPDIAETLRAMSEHQILWGGNYYGLPASRCWLVWDKQVNGAFADCELAWTNLDKPVRKFSWMWNGMLRQGDEARNGHPTQKPLRLMEWCLSFLPDAKTILDPYMGSGTTGVACANFGRHFTGIEIERKYFDIACERIEAAHSQSRLFDELERHVPGVKQSDFGI